MSLKNLGYIFQNELKDKLINSNLKYFCSLHQQMFCLQEMGKISPNSLWVYTFRWIQNCFQRRSFS